MDTVVRDAKDPEAVQTAIALLREGRVVGIPTDTVYGIAADSSKYDAIEQLFIIKERPSYKAIMLLVAELMDLERVAAVVPEAAKRLVARFWPGGLTVIVSARPGLPPNLTADGGTVGVRLPDSDLVRDIIRQLGRPLAATSANLSGRPSPVTAEEVLAQLGGRIPFVLDGGMTPGGVASTVIDCSVVPVRLIRAGAIDVESIEQVLGEKVER